MGSLTHTIAACDASALADLHYRLGRMVEDVPGKVFIHDRATDTNKRHFEGLHISCQVTSTDRLTDFANEARERMGEERWQELQKEWDA